MEEDQKKLELLSQTINGSASFSNYARIYSSPEGMTLKFFYIPPSGPAHLQLVSTIILPTPIGVSVGQTILSIIQQQALQPNVEKKEKTKN